MSDRINHDKITLNSDTSAEDEIGSALFGQPLGQSPEIRPLVQLLRSHKPVPSGVLDMLAEMLDPDGDGYLGLRFDLKNCSSKTNNAERDQLMMGVTIHYKTLLQAGNTSQVAALETAEKFGMSDRQVYRLIKDWERRLKWLKGSGL